MQPKIHLFDCGQATNTARSIYAEPQTLKSLIPVTFDFCPDIISTRFLANYEKAVTRLISGPLWVLVVNLKSKWPAANHN